MKEKIESVLNEYVRPKLLEHQGGVEIVSFDNHVLKVRLTGKCSGCPSATLTTEEIIKEEVLAHMTDIHDVVLVTGVSDELISQARAIWKMRHDERKKV